MRPEKRACICPTALLIRTAPAWEAMAHRQVLQTAAKVSA
jgi:hypothetical protein